MYWLDLGHCIKLHKNANSNKGLVNSAFVILSLMQQLPAHIVVSWIKGSAKSGLLAVRRCKLQCTPASVRPEVVKMEKTVGIVIGYLLIYSGRSSKHSKFYYTFLFIMWWVKALNASDLIGQVKTFTNGFCLRCWKHSCYHRKTNFVVLLLQCSATRTTYMKRMLITMGRWVRCDFVRGLNGLFWCSLHVRHWQQF